MAKKDSKTNNKNVKENNKNKKSFFKGFKAELKKVVWPTPKQLVNNTVAVITIVLLTALIVFVLDLAFESMNKYGVDKLKEIIATESEDSQNTTSNDTNTESDENQTSEDVNVTADENQASSDENASTDESQESANENTSADENQE